MVTNDVWLKQHFGLLYLLLIGCVPMGVPPVLMPIWWSSCCLVATIVGEFCKKKHNRKKNQFGLKDDATYETIIL